MSNTPIVPPVTPGANTPTTPAAPAIPAPVTANTPLAEIAAANAASQATPTPGQPRNPDGTFAAVAGAVPPVTPTPPAAPTPENPVVTTDLGNGQVQVQYLTGETFKGTVAEVAAKIGQSHVTTKQWAQSEIAKAKLPPEAAPPPPPSRFSDPQEEAVARYTADLIAKMLNYPDADTMSRALGHIQDSTTDYSSQLTALQFQAKAPDFNPTPENNEKMFNVILQSGITDEEFGSKTRDQQVMLMQQAHAYCVATGQYQPKPAAVVTARIPSPPPPAPVTGARPLETGGAIPPELQAQPSDSLEVIKQKWEKAAALGLVAPRG